MQQEKITSIETFTENTPLAPAPALCVPEGNKSLTVHMEPGGI
jgi:hypothetical protein